MNEKINVVCSDLTHDGMGVCKSEDKTIFVPFLLKGEKAQIQITVKRQNYYEGKVLERFNESNERIVPKCEYYYDCGGCQLQHMSYPAQLEFKQHKVQETLKRIGKLDVKVDECIGMKEPWKYRNKVQVPFGMTKKGKIQYGFYRQGTHEIIDMDHCEIQPDLSGKILNTIKALLKEHRIDPYDEDRRTGVLRHVLIRGAYYTNEIMVVLITNVDSFPGRNNFVKALKTAHPEITTIVQNINKRSTNVILGTQEKVLSGKGFIEDMLCGVKFRISAMSFYQVNPIQTEALYGKAIEVANLQQDDVIFDAYCGIGTIGLIAAKKVKKVYGVEIVEEAIKDARINARINHINNAEYYAADAKDFIHQIVEAKTKMDVVFIDPPRKGCDNAFLDALLTLKPDRVVYVSCEPSTLARDLNYLVTNSDYQVKSVTPVDMFSQTFHVETVVLMSKNK